MGSSDLDAVRIVSVMNRHNVEYVVIGAYAAIAQQAPIAPTRDIDFTPVDSNENLARVSAALKDLRVLPTLYRFRASRPGT